MLPSLLLRHIGCRATVFVTPGYLGVPENLWWDELAKLILDPATRQEEVSLSLNGHHYAYVFPPSAEERVARIQIASGEPGKPRRGPGRVPTWQSMECWSSCQTLNANRLSQQLRRGATPYADRRQHRCLTEDELRELASGDLVEIGAHTLTHPVLSQLPPDQQQHEIGGSKRRLEALTGKQHHQLRLSLWQEDSLHPADGQNGASQWIRLRLL